MRKQMTKSVNKFATETEAQKFYAGFVDAATGAPKNLGHIRYVKVTMTYSREDGPDSPKTYSVEVWSK
jgi:hypothetical protein